MDWDEIKGINSFVLWVSAFMTWDEIRGINSFALWISAFGSWFVAWTALRLARKENKLELAIDAEYGLKYPRKDIPPSVVIRATNVSRGLLILLAYIGLL